MNENDLAVVVRQSQALIIRTEEDYRSAEAYLKVISDLIKDVQAWFKPQKQKIDEAKREILDKEKAVVAPLEAEKQTLRGKMSVWFTEQEKARQEATRALREQSTGMDETLIEVPKPKVKSQKALWKFRVTDFSRLPDEYKMVDEQKVRAVVTAQKDKTNIPGVEAYIEWTTVTR